MQPGDNSQVPVSQTPQQPPNPFLINTQTQAKSQYQPQGQMQNPEETPAIGNAGAQNGMRYAQMSPNPFVSNQSQGGYQNPQQNVQMMQG